eukprot:2791994-Prymnesium_polylepis.1
MPEKADWEPILAGANNTLLSRCHSPGHRPSAASYVDRCDVTAESGSARNVSHARSAFATRQNAQLMASNGESAYTLHTIA